MSTRTISADIETRPDLDRHPKGLYVLFATEMWERFSFYTMVSMFTLYLRDPNEGFGWTAAQASTLYANYMMFVYCSPLIGGWIADKKLGYRRAVMLGGFFFMAYADRGVLDRVEAFDFLARVERSSDGDVSGAAFFAEAIEESDAGSLIEPISDERNH